MALNLEDVYNSADVLIGYKLRPTNAEEALLVYYPMPVYDNAGNLIGTANSPAQYVFIWNSSLENRSLGKLFLGTSSLDFYVKKKATAFSIEAANDPCPFANVYDACNCLKGYTLPMLTTTGAAIETYPVDVLNVDEVFIGVANNPAQYVYIWNSDAANQAYGVLYVGSGAFCFYLKKINDTTPPGFVLGAGEETTYYIITESSDYILLENGGRIPLEN